MKGKGSPAAKAYQDEDELGRLQCVVALSDGAFEVWPGSHNLSTQRRAHVKGRWTNVQWSSHDVMKELEDTCKRVVFSCGPGDVLIFQGGSLFHGSPAVEEHNPSPMVVTYASFWPPGTLRGTSHAKRECTCFDR